VGQALSDLNWLYKKPGEDRFQRRKCDLRMVEEVFAPDEQSRGGPTVLQLCTVPQKPPSELPAGKLRLKGVTPQRISCGQVQPVHIVVDTSLLEEGPSYVAAFTHQHSLQTFTSEATLLSNHKALQVTVPWNLLADTTTSQADGLYDVHIVVDQKVRSENRRTLTVVSAESELSSSSAAVSASDSFDPISTKKT